MPKDSQHAVAALRVFSGPGNPKDATLLSAAKQELSR
jgi:hypothetical protein